MPQAHPELNFRKGRGAIRERRKAFSRDGLAATCDFLGMTSEDKDKFLAETDAIRAGEKWTCVDCDARLPSPTPDPFRCARCRQLAAGLGVLSAHVVEKKDDTAMARRDIMGSPIDSSPPRPATGGQSTDRQ